MFAVSNGKKQGHVVLGLGSAAKYVKPRGCCFNARQELGKASKKSMRDMLASGGDIRAYNDGGACFEFSLRDAEAGP